VRRRPRSFYELGLGEVLTVSAIQGIGTGDLLDKVVERLPVSAEEEESADPRVAIVGRPNVGNRASSTRSSGPNAPS
jgi:GTP-binding protein